MDILDILDPWTFHMTWYLGRTSMCNDREQSRIEKSETCSNFQYMCSVALPNLPLSSPVLIQENQLNIRISQKTHNKYLIILTFINKNHANLIKPPIQD